MGTTTFSDPAHHHPRMVRRSSTTEALMWPNLIAVFVFALIVAGNTIFIYTKGGHRRDLD